MLVLDTNVISELMRLRPDPGALAWVDGQNSHDLYLTSVSAAELLYGIARLPTGQRRSRLADAISSVLDEDFAGRVLPFDLSAALEYSSIVASRERAGRPISRADAMIAATAVAFGASAIATRNVRDFANCGLAIIDPWKAQ